MATQSTYYLNGPSLSSATAVFTDANLTTCAPDGYYRQGNIVRQLVGCVLLPPQTCPSCADACDGGLIESATGYAVFNVPIDTGSNPSDVGAIIITFNPLATPDGIQAELNGVIYNSVSSENEGFLSAPTNFTTFVGTSAGDCGLVAGSPYVLDVYSWYNSAFGPTATTENVSILPTQMHLTAGPPGVCTMVVPKTTPTPSIITVKITSPCPTNDFALNVNCPVLLNSFPCSTGFPESNTACASDEGETYYYVHVNGASGVLGLYDWVFSDQYGENVLTSGYYKSAACPAANEWFRVEDGIITEFGTCL